MPNCKMLVSANILLRRIYTRIQKNENSFLLCGKKQWPVRKEETIGQLIHTNEAYAHILYMCMWVYAYVHVLGWRELCVYFGLDISELHYRFLVKVNVNKNYLNTVKKFEWWVHEKPSLSL